MVKISFLSRLFPKPVEEAEVPVIELKDWLQEFSEDKLKAVDETIHKTFLELAETVNTLRNRLDELSQAQLLNENISARERHLMEGNRFSYIKKINFFLDSIKIPKAGYDEIMDFCKWFSDDLDELNKKSGKGYYLLKNFFDREVGNIAEEIKNLEGKVISVRSIVESEEIKGYRELFREIRTLNETEIKYKAYDARIRELESSVMDIEERRRKIRARIDAISKSEGFSEYHKLEEKRQQALRGIQDAGTDITRGLLQISKYLKKFAHGTEYEALVDGYFTNSLDALKNDEGLMILIVLRKLAKAVESNELDVEKKLQKKLAEAVDAMDASYFRGKRTEIAAHNQEISRLNSEIEKNSVMMNYKEQAYEEEHLNTKLKDASQELDRLRSEKSNLLLEDMRSKLQEKLYSVTGTKVTIML